MRSRISTIKMGVGESLYEYWARFKLLLAKCPQHRIPDQDLIQYFVAGMRPQEIYWVNATCGGFVLNKMPSEAFKLFEEMAEEARDEGEMMRSAVAPSQADDKVDKLCSTIENLLSNMNPAHVTVQKKAVKRCEVCSASTHATDQCPLWFEDEDVNAVGQTSNGFGQKKFDPNTQTYNAGWRQHENLRYRNNQPRDQGKGNSLRDIVEKMAAENLRAQQENEKFKVETRDGFNNVNAQLSHLAQVVARLEKNQGALPTQVEVNKAQVNAVTLRSGKALPEATGQPKKEALP